LRRSTIHVARSFSAAAAGCEARLVDCTGAISGLALAALRKSRLFTLDSG
jgi:hypothetical protein